MTLRYRVTFMVRKPDDGECIELSASMIQTLVSELGRKVKDNWFSTDTEMRLLSPWTFHAGDTKDPRKSVYEAVGRLEHVEFEDTIYGHAGGSVGRLPPK